MEGRRGRGRDRFRANTSRRIAVRKFGISITVPSPPRSPPAHRYLRFRSSNNRRITLTLLFAHGHVEVVGRRHAVVLARAAPGLVFDAQEVRWAVHSAAGLVHEHVDGVDQTARVEWWHASDKRACVNANGCESYGNGTCHDGFDGTIEVGRHGARDVKRADDYVGTAVRRRRRVECLCRRRLR